MLSHIFLSDTETWIFLVSLEDSENQMLWGDVKSSKMFFPEFW